MNQRADRNPQLWILLIALLSGAICLIYQIVWSRYLNLILGVSAYAVATVLTCFMLGLALGAWQIGRLIDRTERRVPLLLGLELALGLYILLSPMLYQLISRVDTRGLQLGLAIASLLLPTFLMGGTFPVFIRIAAGDVQGIGSRAGMIYAINTLGAALGALLTGFVLIGGIGLSKTLYLAGVICFVIAVILALTLRDPGPAPEPLVRKKPKPPKKPVPSASFVPIILIFGICGFTGLAYEVYWTRLLSLFFKDSIYDLTIVLTTYLTGLAAGSFICSRLLNRVKRPRDLLSVILILIGFSALLGLYLVDQFPYWINHLQTNSAMVERYGSRFWLAGNAIRFGYALLLMFVPTFLFGAVLPIVSRLGTDQIETVGRRIGLLSAVNTLGSALGALLGGFVFIQMMGLAHSISLMAFLNILAGVVLIPSWLGRIAVLLIAMIVAGMAPPWDRVRMSLSFLEADQPLEKFVKQEFYREDIHGTTSVVNVASRKFLVTNRLFTQNTSAMNGTEDHRRLGHLPLLLHPAPKTALAVGLGAGITLRGMADHPLNSIDCVEISPAVVEAAKYFPDENARVLERQKVHMHVDDARHFMRTAQSQYDVIVLDIFHPMSGGSSMIFSREYYELSRRRLAPGGLICQWLPAHQLSIDEIQTVAATFQSVFPHVSLWFGLIGESTAVVGLIGSEQPLAIDYARLAETCKQHPELREIELQTPEQVLSHFVMADQDLRNFAGAAPIDTDDRPIIELAAPRLTRRAASQGTFNLTLLAEQMKDIRRYVTQMPEDPSLQREIGLLRKQIDSLGIAVP